MKGFGFHPSIVSSWREDARQLRSCLWPPALTHSFIWWQSPHRVDDWGGGSLRFSEDWLSVGIDYEGFILQSHRVWVFPPWQRKRATGQDRSECLRRNKAHKQQKKHNLWWSEAVCFETQMAKYIWDGWRLCIVQEKWCVERIARHLLSWGQSSMRLRLLVGSHTDCFLTLWSKCC